MDNWCLALLLLRYKDTNWCQWAALTAAAPLRRGLKTSNWMDMMHGGQTPKHVLHGPFSVRFLIQSTDSSPKFFWSYRRQRVFVL